MQKKLKWSETCLVHVIFRIFYFRRDWKIKFWPVSACTLFCVEVQMVHHHQSYRSLNSWLLPLCKCLCHCLPDVMLSVCVFSAQHTHCWNVSWWHSQSLRVNVFEFWHATGPSGLAKDLVCAPTLQAYVVRMFSVCGLLYSGLRSAMFRSVEMRVCLKLNQRVVKVTSCPQ